MEIDYVIQWIEIYQVDSVIHLLSNWGGGGRGEVEMLATPVPLPPKKWIIMPTTLHNTLYVSSLF